MINLITRAQWGARPPKGNAGTFSSKQGFQLHHTASPRAEADHANCDDKIRAVQNVHMDDPARNWLDIAYNFIVCNHEFTFEGRGWFTQNGATGSPVANDTRIAICWLGHSDKDVFDIRAARQIHEIVNAGVSSGWPAKVGGHKDFSSTTCPGNVLYWWMGQQQWGTVVTPPSPPPAPQPMVDILSLPSTTIEQMQSWAKAQNSTRRFVELAVVAYDEAVQLGIDPAVVYAIMAHETAFGRFGGILNESFHNWGGIKTTQGGDNNDPNAHQRFANDRIGVRAVAQHAGLYGGLYVPADEVVDPRHFEPIRGIAPTLPSAGWTWAGSTHDDNIIAKVQSLRTTP